MKGERLIATPLQVCLTQTRMRSMKRLELLPVFVNACFRSFPWRSVGSVAAPTRIETLTEGGGTCAGVVDGQSHKVAMITDVFERGCSC